MIKKLTVPPEEKVVYPPWPLIRPAFGGMGSPSHVEKAEVPQVCKHCGASIPVQYSMPFCGLRCLQKFGMQEAIK